MKITANKFEANDIIRIIREWTELTQEEFASSINRTRGCIQKYENGGRKFTFETFMLICKKHKIKVTIEKVK